MLRRLRENGPALLVPLAWTFVTAAHLEYVAPRTLLIAHVVMVVLLVGFAALSWSEMRSGVLLAWRRVFVVGTGLTLAGAAGLLATPDVEALLWVAAVGWMVLPAVALVYTGQRVAERPALYLAAGGLSVLGAAVYVLAPVVGGTAATVAGLALVGVGQTAGILTAVVTY